MKYLLECTLNIYDDGYTVIPQLKYLAHYLRENIDDCLLHLFDNPIHMFDITFDNVAEPMYTSQ
jgi:hypothetical protein